MTYGAQVENNSKGCGGVMRVAPIGIFCAAHPGLINLEQSGYLAGNIIGALVGYEAIPEKYKRNFELHDLILSVADDLCGASTDEQMLERYKDHLHYNINPSDLL